MSKRDYRHKLIAFDLRQCSNDFDHLSPEFFNFVEQLWDSEKNFNSAEFLLNHLWLRQNQHSFRRNYSLPPLVTDSSSAAASHLCSGIVFYKLSQRDVFGRRRWRKAYGVLYDQAFFLYPDSPSSPEGAHQALPPALPLSGKAVAYESMSRHPNTFAIVFSQSSEVRPQYGYDMNAIPKPDTT